MELEDEYRFQVEAVPMPTDCGEIWLSCDRCNWQAEITEAVALADLRQRAEEHTEVCR